MWRPPRMRANACRWSRGRRPRWTSKYANSIRLHWCVRAARSSRRGEAARLDPEPVLQITRHAAANFQRLGKAAQVHEMLAAGIASDAFQVPCIHQCVTVDAHEARGKFLFEDLQRIVDEILALQMPHRGVFLVGMEAQHFL